MATRKKEAGPRHHYEAMGTDRGSTAEEVKARWRELSRQLHPDRHGGTPEANDRFATVTQAYAVLGDEKRRRQYDAQLDLASQKCDTCSGEGRLWKRKGFGREPVGACHACGGSGRTERKTR